MQGQGGGALTMVYSCPLGVQAKVSPDLCVAQGHLSKLQNNLRWLLLVLGLEIPRQSQAVNLGLLLLVLDLGPLSKFMGAGGYCLFDRI